jgi:ribonuclease HI
MKIVVHTDGGSRSNPGPAAIGILIEDEFGQKIHQIGEFIGIATNNEAEYLAVIRALEWIFTNSSELKTSQVTFYLDSLLVVQQLNKKWKIKEKRLQDLAVGAWSIIKKLPETTLNHIKREENKAADLLVNQALDEKLGSSAH